MSHCVECSSALDPWEGQAGPRRYHFHARAVAHALAKVAGGASYRRAALSARQHADRERSNEHLSLHGQLVANWVDVFTPVVTWGEIPSMWPRMLLVDSKRFMSGDGTTWHAIIAMGVEAPGRKPQLWCIRPVPRLNQAEWQRFFGSMPGTPDLVVADMAPNIAAAAAAAFPATTRFHMCEYHLGVKLDQRLAGLPSHLLRGELRRRAFISPADWSAFEAVASREFAAGDTRLRGLLAWCRKYGPGISAQAAVRRPDEPHGTGAVEEIADTLGERLPRRRANRLANRNRTTMLLDLMTADLRRPADELAWATKIRRYLEGRSGVVPLGQRSNDDPAGVASLRA